MKKYSIILFCLIGWGIAVAQPINKPTYSKTINKAKELEAKGDYYNALEWFLKAYEESDDKSLSYPIGVLQYRIRDYKRAERSFARVMKKDADKYPDVRFLYGRTLKMNEKYEKAVPVLQEFINKTEDAKLKELAEIELTGAEMAIELPPRLEVNVEGLGKNINSKSSEYSPTIDGKTLYFTSFNTDEVIEVNEENVDYHVRIYQSKQNEEAEWGKPKELGQKINRKGFHNSNVHIAGDRMYFTRALIDGDILTESKIMISREGDDGWQGADKVVGVNGEYIAKHPMTGELFGKEVLFFVSDMDGGYGGFDIYYATLKGDGVYGDPVNLGPKINTIGDEETPFFSNESAALYFSSTGHPGIGGFDVFFTEWNGTIWSAPKNMGKGFNSSVDDLFFTIDEEGYTGFLVSNRASDGKRSIKSKTCCNDIYAYEIPKITADLVAGTFTADKKPLKGASVEIVELTNNERVNPYKQDNKDGNVFNFGMGIEKSYMLIATHPDYYPDSAAINTVGLKDSKSFEQRFYLRKLPPPEPEYETISSESPIELSNIYYDFDDDRILEPAEQDLEYLYELMTEYADMRIELGSHTDARGNATYNEGLSQRRAESARRWLVRKGIERARIDAKGYGKSVPKTISEKQAADYDFLSEGDVLTEEFINGLEGEETQETAHQLNRRTEFRIVSGPTSIKVSTKRLKKQEKKVNPNTTEPSKVQPRRSNGNRRGGPNPIEIQGVLKIHKLSSLYGKKNLKGVPVMQFDKRVVDLGSLKKGEKRKHTYTFTNMGDTALEIENVDYCECTEAEWTRRIVEPGEQGKVDIIFDSTEKDAAETIDITIMLKQNDPANELQIFETIQYKFDLIQE